MPLSLAPLREVVDQRSKARWILSGGAEGKVAVIACMFGQNPRAALVAALSRAARQMKKRQGAFARYR